MARPSSSVWKGVVAFSGMVTFVGAVSMIPRISILRDENTTMIRYRHMKVYPSKPAPADPGMILSPAPNQAKFARQTPFRENDWIFDTGATTHVCTKRDLLHSYSSYEHTRFSKSMGYFGPNPIQILGIGDCTLDLPGPKPLEGSSTSTSEDTGTTIGFSNPLTPYFNPHSHNGNSQSYPQQQNQPSGYRTAGRITIQNVSHIPSAGINIISWSQLKRAKGMNLRLVENGDGSLSVVNGTRPGTQIMRFELRDGLYFLDQAA